MTVHPRAGQLPAAGDLIDLDRLLAAYRDEPPAEPVAFGTSGHRGTSLDGSFTEAHVVAISAAVCAYRSEQGIARST
jgi:phosphoglucomutase